jgi:hypothetical protein
MNRAGLHFLDAHPAESHFPCRLRLYYGEVTVPRALRMERSKAAANLRNHDVSFDEASSVFFDPLSTTGSDTIRSMRDVS